jgi:hypothetical protein
VLPTLDVLVMPLVVQPVLLQDLRVSAIRTFPIFTYLNHDHSIRVFLLFDRFHDRWRSGGRCLCATTPVSNLQNGSAIWPEPEIYILGGHHAKPAVENSGTSEHCRVAGHSLPNLSNMIRLSAGESSYFDGGGDLTDTQRMPHDGNCMGDEGKAVGSAQAPAALL